MDTDTRLLDRLAVGVDDGFESLVRGYQDRLFAFALALTGNGADAEEVAQDAFLRAHKALRKYEPERILELKLGGWLYRITLNVVRNRVRSRRLQLVPMDTAAEPADRRPGPEQEAERRELLAELAHAVSRLPAHQRDAVVLRHVRGLTYAEAAELLEQPEGTIRSNVHRGLAALRRQAGVLSEVS
jgi:RNA polymerase sigma factor (sigma-70 family)